MSLVRSAAASTTALCPPRVMPPNPAQNHSVHFTSGTDYGQCNAIRAVLDGVLGAPQGLEGVENQKPLSRSRKLVRNGQIYILRGGKTYTVTGMEVNLE